MDKFELPQLVTDVILNMKKNGVCELEIQHMDELLTNFPNKDIGLDFSALIKGKDEKPKKITITITIIDVVKPKDYKAMKGQEKVDHVLSIKATAARFFKDASQPNNFQSAADQYQRIIQTVRFTGWEVEEDDEAGAKITAELRSLKMTAYTNIIVCNHKMQNWRKVIEAAQKLLKAKLSPNNVKAMYFKGYAHVKLKEYDEGRVVLERLLTVDPEHGEGKKLLAVAKKQKLVDQQNEAKKYAKMFQ